MQCESKGRDRDIFIPQSLTSILNAQIEEGKRERERGREGKREREELDRGQFREGHMGTDTEDSRKREKRNIKSQTPRKPEK